MTAVSLINPYAPQPLQAHAGDTGAAASQAMTPVAASAATTDAGLSSDQSGQGARNGTGTGGAQLAVLLERGREAMPFQRATPKSVVEAQSESDPATEFLARQALKQAQAEAAEQTRLSQEAAARAADAQAKAREALKPRFEMPNPLPTAPILKRN